MLTLTVAMYVEVPMAFFGDGILIYQVIEVGAQFHFISQDFRKFLCCAFVACQTQKPQTRIVNDISKTT